MKNDSINENEAIQQGLEKFLQEELSGIAANTQEKPAGRTAESRTGMPQQSQGGPQVITPQQSQRGPQVITPQQSQGGPRVIMPQQSQAEPMVNMPRQSQSEIMTDAPEEIRGRTGRQNMYKEDGYGNDVNRNVKKTANNTRKSGTGKGSTVGKKKKKSKLKKLLLLFLFLVILFAGLWYLVVGSAYNQMQYNRDEELATEPMKEDGVTNILLIGNDSRNEGEDGRSDAMILLSISNKTKKIHMTSLLRDMYVDIPGRDGNRLNAAYAYGGPSLLLDTIEQNLGITVNRYVLVNFQAFAGLVDAVGGVDLELTNEEVKWVNAYLNEYNMLEGREMTTDYLDESLSGMIHLNGPQALAYCRNRYIGSDFERTNRQRKVLSAIAGKLPAAMATNSKELLGSLLPNLTTNLTQSECYSLSLSASKFLTYEIVQTSIPIEGSYKNADIRGMSVLEVDFEQNKSYIRKNIYGEE